jgi:hypothetical protein
MNTEDKELIKQAKKLALTQGNANREKIGLPPLKQVSSLWWRMYGKEFINRVIKERGTNETPKSQ